MACMPEGLSDTPPMGQEYKCPPTAQYAPQSIGILKKFGTIESEEWQNDGSLSTVIVLSPGSKITLIEKLNSLTKGNIIADSIE